MYKNAYDINSEFKACLQYLSSLYDTDKFTSFRKELPNIINTIESGRKTIGMLKSIYESFGQVRVLIETHNDETPFSSEYLSENPFAEARRRRDEFKEVKQKMNVLMDICGKLAAGAPTGMKGNGSLFSVSSRECLVRQVRHGTPENKPEL